jgi:SAM-dependent methyltransferase
MAATRASTPQHWDDYWNALGDDSETYDTGDRVIEAIQAVADPRGARVLEVGAGSGRDATRLAALGAHVTVIDYVRSSLDVVQRNADQAGVQITLVHGDAIGMPFPDGTFDVVYHQGLLEHFRDPHPLLAENVRVLRSGGVLVVDVPQRWHLYTAVKKVLIAADKWFAGWETEFTVRDLERLASAHGLDVVLRYGDWMRPSFAYRSARVMVGKAGVRLPLRPNGRVANARLRAGVRDRARSHRAAFYTYMDVGVAARKP